MTSASILIAALLYAVGLIIVNGDLSQHYVVSLGLARAEYVMAGTLWLFFTAIGSGGFDLAFENIRTGWSRKHRRMIVVGLLDIVVMLAAFFAVLLFIAPQLVKATREVVTMLGVLALNGLMARAFVKNIIGVARAREFGARVLFGPSGLAGIPNRVFVATYALAGIVAYAVWVFPAIPQTFGGGMKPAVRLVLAEPEQSLTQELGLPMWPVGKSVGPVELLLETDSYFFVSRMVANPNKTIDSGILARRALAPAVAVEKKAVRGIVYLSPDEVVAKRASSGDRK